MLALSSVTSITCTLIPLQYDGYGPGCTTITIQTK